MIFFSKPNFWYVLIVFVKSNWLKTKRHINYREKLFVSLKTFMLMKKRTYFLQNNSDTFNSACAVKNTTLKKIYLVFTSCSEPHIIWSKSYMYVKQNERTLENAEKNILTVFKIKTNITVKLQLSWPVVNGKELGWPNKNWNTYQISLENFLITITVSK